MEGARDIYVSPPETPKPLLRNTQPTTGNFFAGDKRWSIEVITQLHLQRRLTMNGAILVLPDMPAWREQVELKSVHNFSKTLVETAFI
jgi:hypothetical protein